VIHEIFGSTDWINSVTDDPTLPQIQRDNTWGISETFSRVSGKRTYKLGFNWVHFQLNYRQSNRIRGQYTYSGAFTGNGLDAGDLRGVNAGGIIEKHRAPGLIRACERCSGLQVQAVPQPGLDDFETERANNIG
jgi:hypothetical protein